MSRLLKSRGIWNMSIFFFVFLRLLCIDLHFVLPKNGDFPFKVSFDVERMLWIEGSFDVEPVVVQCLFLDILIFVCHFLVPCFNVFHRLRKLLRFDPALYSIVIESCAHHALSKRHIDDLKHFATALVFEVAVDGQRNFRPLKFFI